MTTPPVFAIVVGTRPEVIKVAPVLRALQARGTAVRMISTGQHREMSRGVFAELGLRPSVDLDLMRAQQSPLSLTAEILSALPDHLVAQGASSVLVQGDTATAFAAAFVGYQLGLPVGHIEAGLRTGDHANPFPEEGNRKLIGQIARHHFAPTDLAADNLRREGIDRGAIHVVGNTAIDSLLHELASSGGPSAAGAVEPFVLVTLHRRESFGRPLEDLVRALDRFLVHRPSARVIWPLHPNPRVREVVDECFTGHDRVTLIEPQSYRQFVRLLADARLVLSDSGGVQEEAPSLGKVVLVARDATERPEGLAAGRNRLVGRTTAGVLDALLVAWDEPPYAGPVPAPSPFGYGRAGEAIADILLAAPPVGGPL
jgi:UDP-N-acetylglucosamine 2-epimerase (non-hydrolysing)